VAELRRTEPDPSEDELMTTHAFSALVELLGPHEYEEAREEGRANGTYWKMWLPAMWRRVDELGLRADALAAVAEANHRANFRYGRQQGLLRPVRDH
jgi:hypothetical protein